MINRSERVFIPLMVGVLTFLVNFSILTYLFSAFPWIVSLFFGKGSWWVYQPFNVKVFYVVGIAPVVEEIIHRRIVLQFFLSRDLLIFGLVVSSLTFGVHHVIFGWGWLKAVDMFFVGLVFGIIYTKYKLLGSWLSHFSNNLMSILFTILMS